MPGGSPLVEGPGEVEVSVVGGHHEGAPEGEERLRGRVRPLAQEQRHRLPSAPPATLHQDRLPPAVPRLHRPPPRHKLPPTPLLHLHYFGSICHLILPLFQDVSNGGRVVLFNTPEQCV